MRKVLVGIYGVPLLRRLVSAFVNARMEGKIALGGAELEIMRGTLSVAKQFFELRLRFSLAVSKHR